MRINARLDQETMTQVHYLTKSIGLTLSSMIKESIHFFYRHIRAQESNPAKILMETGFIDSGTGEKDLSKNYKNVLNKALSEKHGYR